MIVELHSDAGKVGEVAISAAGRAVGLDDVARRMMETTVIVEPGNPPVLVTPGDGERYLRALPVNLAGTRFWAELVE